MSKRLLVILLLVSFAFNLAVAGVFFWMTVFRPWIYPCGRAIPPRCPPHHEMPFPGMHHEMHGKFGQFREQMRPYRQNFAECRHDFLHCLANEPFVEKDARAALEKSLKAHEELERNLGNRMIEIRKKMSAEDAKIYFHRHIDRFKNHKTKTRRSK